MHQSHRVEQASKRRLAVAAAAWSLAAWVALATAESATVFAQAPASDAAVSSASSRPRARLVPEGLNGAGALTFRRSADGARMIWIPAGTYARRAYTRRESMDVPVRQVPVAGFAIDETEVTNAQFCRFLNAVTPGRDDEAVRRWVTAVPQGMETADGGWRPVSGCGTLPALGVTGHGALAYARWVGGDLPTIDEWQKAASGPEGRKFPWGDAAPDATRANFFADGPGMPTPVGSYPKGMSPYGCLDMAGNVAERVWTAGRGGRGAAPVMIRGAGWASPHPMNLRTSCLCMQPMGVADRTVGFRCVVRVGDGLPRAVTRLRIRTDWDDARREAAERNCPILASLQFDTCGQCDRIKVGLFRDPAFVAYVNEHAVMVVGQNEGDAESAPHRSGPDDWCPLLPGLRCMDHLAMYGDVIRRVGGFRMSPGNFILNPHVEGDEPKPGRILIGERRLPKWGGGAAVYIARLKEAQATLGKAIPYSEWRRRKADASEKADGEASGR